MIQPGVITCAEAADAVWDAAMIGAGPAGSVAAYLLAKAGLKTLLVDRAAWPRYKVCGGCLNGRTLSILRAIGLTDVLRQCSGTRVSRFCLHAQHRQAEVRSAGVAIDRAAFDAALVDAAVAVGARFLPSTSALVEVDSESMARRIKLTQPGKASLQTRARVVVVADGLARSSLAQLPEFSCRVSHQARIGLGMMVDELSGAFEPDAIHMAVAPGGYLGWVQTANGQWNLAAAVDPAFLRRCKNPRDATQKLLQAAGVSLPSLAGGPAWHGTLPLTRRSNRLFGRRIFLIGDAASYAEPFTGEGIGWAMQSALAVAPQVTQNFAAWDESAASRWESGERSRFAKSQLACRLVIPLLRKPLAVRLALGVLKRAPWMARPWLNQVQHESRDFRDFSPASAGVSQVSNQHAQAHSL